MADVERKEVPKVPEGVEVRPEEMGEIPWDVERKEAQKPDVAKTQFTAQVTDDQGKPLTESPATRKVTIILPKTEQEIETMGKGKPEDTETWWGRFLKRIVRRAKYLGWTILSRGKNQES